MGPFLTLLSYELPVAVNKTRSNNSSNNKNFKMMLFQKMQFWNQKIQIVQMLKERFTSTKWWNNSRILRIILENIKNTIKIT